MKYLRFSLKNRPFPFLSLQRNLVNESSFDPNEIEVWEDDLSHRLHWLFRCVRPTHLHFLIVVVEAVTFL